jgi:hypothetical protein
MVGPCDTITEASSGKKPTPRKIQVTFTVADPNGDGVAYKNLKGSDDDDADDADHDEEQKKPSVYYQVYGNEIDNEEYGIEFKGGFAPIYGGGLKEIRLLCQVRRSNRNTTVTDVATTSAATATAAVAVGKVRYYENDDNIEDVDEDGINHNELIALHEEAQLSTEALKKRYRGPSMDHTHDERDKNGQQMGSFEKKFKKDDDDDDDDIEF